MKPHNDLRFSTIEGRIAVAAGPAPVWKSRWLHRWLSASLAAGIWLAPTARAGLTLDLQLQRVEYDGSYYYGCALQLATNATPPNLDYGTYRLESPNQPSSGFNATYVFDLSGFHLVSGGGSLYTGFDEFLDNITNGTWSLRATNNTATNLYHFTVTAEVTSNSLAAVVINFPVEGATGVTNQPTFSWTGPTDWQGSLYVQSSYTDTNGDDVYFESTSPSATATSWAAPNPLPEGTNRLFVQYSSNATASITATTPTNSLGAPISSWVFGATLTTYADSRFVVGDLSAVAANGHTNLAHYAFENAEDLGEDSSLNSNHFNGSSTWGTPVHEPDPMAAAGTGAVRFYGVSSITMSPPLEAFTNVTSVLAGSFSLSLWVLPGDFVGFDEDDAIDGAAIVWLYNDHNNTNDIIPLAITGTKAAFSTRDDQGITDTLHSTTSLDDGFYHHLVVTRDRETGEKRVYVDGQLEGTQVGTTNFLNGNDYYFSLGGTSYASYVGLVDDVQIYSGVLSANEVAELYAHPGLVIPDASVGGSTNPPVDVEMELSLVRTRELSGADIFSCFPNLVSVNVPEVTQHRIESPNGEFSGTLTGASSSGQSSYDNLVSACTSGNWKLFINEGDASEQVFHFSVLIDPAASNLFQPVLILSPANGTTNVPPQPGFAWSGPAGFSGAFVQKYELPYLNVVSTNLPGTATNWPVPPPLSPGTNHFYISVYTNHCPLITITTPVDATFATPIHGWSATAHLNSDANSRFVVSALPTPVQLAGAQVVGSSFQFQFQSEPGRTNTVQSRTNLLLGSWQDRTNVIGDGMLQAVSLPVSDSPTEFFRVVSR